MNYEEFLDYVKSNISKLVGKEKKVNINKVLKTNDIEYDALTIIDSESNISPTIYLNQYYDEYSEGTSIGKIINDIYTLYEEHNNGIEFDIDFFKNFDNIKKRIAYKVVNASQNQKLLSDCPHVKILDLALVFYTIIDSDYIGSATSLIHYSHLDIWNIDSETLISIAYENTPRILKPEIRNMNDIIYEMFEADLQKQQLSGDIPLDIEIHKEAKEAIDSIRGESTIEMYVLTNSQKLYGASCIFYKDVLKEFAKNFGKNIFILPSSIHEVILVPINEQITPSSLSLMVKDVNSEVVDNSEILSDHAYIYDIIKDEIVM